MSLTETFNALSDENRQRIIDMLKKEEMSVSDMLKKLDITMPTLSHHLDMLKRADLISGRRSGQQIFYSLNLSIFEEVAEQVIKFLKVKK
jgi:ArsR family transcriptional regulator, arsenate/arsenite/antimonite-responsive transcriptional repressor